MLAAGHDHLLADLAGPRGFARQILSGAGSVEQDGDNAEVVTRQEGAEPRTPSCGFVLLDHHEARGWAVHLVAHCANEVLQRDR